LRVFDAIANFTNNLTDEEKRICCQSGIVPNVMRSLYYGNDYDTHAKDMFAFLKKTVNPVRGYRDLRRINITAQLLARIQSRAKINEIIADIDTASVSIAGSQINNVNLIDLYVDKNILGTDFNKSCEGLTDYLSSKPLT